MGINDFARNDFSQNGDDGIIEHVFDVIGTQSKWACEFGAWDGIHFSNTRGLILRGWSAVLIEAAVDRYQELCHNYRNREGVICLNAMVGTENNSLGELIGRAGAPDQLDLLVIDIDGLDYTVFANLKIRPRVVVVEVNAGHDPSAARLLSLELASRNIGQPLTAFCDLARSLGYRLVCYNANAFFLRSDVGQEDALPTLSAEVAYQAFLDNLSEKAREWLLLVNKGRVPPYHRFGNSWLTAESLGIGKGRQFWLEGEALAHFICRSARSFRARMAWLS